MVQKVQFFVFSAYSSAVLFIVICGMFVGLRLVNTIACVLSELTLILHLENQVDSLFTCLCTSFVVCFMSLSDA